MTFVHLRDISARAGAFTLPACSADFSSRVCAIFGDNGAGKSTLLRCLAGLDHHDGVVETDAHARVAVFNPPDFYAHLNAFGNLSILLSCFPGAASRADMKEALAGAGLGSVSRIKVGKLSTGQRKMLGFVFADLSGADLVMLDEITEGVDADGLAWMRERIRTASPDRLWLLSGHDRTMAESLGATSFVLDSRGLNPLGTLSPSGPTR